VVVCLSVCLSVSVCVLLSVCVWLSMSHRLSASGCLFVSNCLSVCVWLSVCVSLPICLCLIAYLSVYLSNLSICLNICLPVPGRAPLRPDELGHIVLPSAPSRSSVAACLSPTRTAKTPPLVFRSSRDPRCSRWRRWFRSCRTPRNSGPVGSVKL
jgi:hypothetical protein